MKKVRSNISKAVRELVFMKTNGRCWYCGEKLIVATKEKITGSNVFCVEHIDNLGGDDLSNLYPSCRRCNILKKDKTLEGFRLWLSAPVFTERQIEYLRLHNIEIPNPELFVFWGETL